MNRQKVFSDQQKYQEFSQFSRTVEAIRNCFDMNTAGISHLRFYAKKKIPKSVPVASGKAKSHLNRIKMVQFGFNFELRLNLDVILMESSFGATVPYWHRNIESNFCDFISKTCDVAPIAKRLTLLQFAAHVSRLNKWTKKRDKLKYCNWCTVRKRMENIQSASHSKAFQTGVLLINHTFVNSFAYGLDCALSYPSKWFFGCVRVCVWKAYEMRMFHLQTTQSFIQITR